MEELEALPTDHLPLPVAFDLLFTREEKSEIGFDGFVSDLAESTAEAVPSRGLGASDEEVVGYAPLVGRAAVGRDLLPPSSISLDEAIAYLRREQ